MSKLFLPLLFTIFISCTTSSENTLVENEQEKDTIPTLIPKELEIISEGLSSDDTYLYAGGMRTTSVYFKYGEKVYINFIRISGLTEIEGLIFPRIDGYVLNDKGDTLVSGVDLDLGIDQGYKPENGGIDLNTNIYFDDPFLPGENYKWEVYVRDRNSEKFLKTSAVLAVSHNESIEISNKNAELIDIYLYDLEEGLVIRKNKVFSGQSFKMYFDGIRGFTEKAENVHAGMEISLTNSEGATMLYAENALSDYAEAGLSSAIFTSSIYALIELPEDESGEMLLTIRIYDLNGDAEVKGTVKLDVVKLG